MKNNSDASEIMNKDLELRCQCSRLLFKKLQEAIEVKCPRCKRIHTFTVAQLKAFLEAGNFCAIYDISSKKRGPDSKNNI